MEPKITKIELRPHRLVGYCIGLAGHRIIEAEGDKPADIELVDHDKYTASPIAPTPMAIWPEASISLAEIVAQPQRFRNITREIYEDGSYLAAWQREFTTVENNQATISWSKADIQAFTEVWRKKFFPGQEEPPTPVISEIGLVDEEGKVAYMVACLIVLNPEHQDAGWNFTFNIETHVPASS